MKELDYDWSISWRGSVKVIIIALWFIVYLCSDYAAIVIRDNNIFRSDSFNVSQMADVIRGCLNVLICAVVVVFTLLERAKVYRIRISQGEGLKNINFLLMPLALSLVPLAAAGTDFARALGSPLLSYLILDILLLLLVLFELFWVFRFEQNKKDVFRIVFLHMVLFVLLCVVALAISTQIA